MMQPLQPDTRKTISPAIYALILEGKGMMFLSIQFAYCLEDAFSMAQNEFLRQNPKLVDTLQGAKISLFAIKSIDQLVRKTEQTVTPVPVVNASTQSKPIPKKPVVSVVVPTPQKEEIKMVDKNTLMKQIIDSKSEELLNLNKAMFTKVELKFLRDKLK